MHRMLTALGDRRLALQNEDEKQKGFTLIELLVVVIIIGILAAIAIPVFLNQRTSAWQSSVGSDLKNAAIVVETYGTSNNGSYTGFAAVDGSPTEIRVSDGNTIEVTVDATDGNSYTILGGNENILDGAQMYDSADGGLLDWDDSLTPPTPAAPVTP